ncbi:hypothetical protein AH01_63 [Pantoea phage AH01]|nr:hypothetical protein AH01_63 [Pantoea phage AH01]
MKIRLLNNDGFGGLENVKFPVEVDGQPWQNCGYDVVSSDLLPFGADPELWGDEALAFWHNHEVEVVE